MRWDEIEGKRRRGGEEEEERGRWGEEEEEHNRKEGRNFSKINGRIEHKLRNSVI